MMYKAAILRTSKPFSYFIIKVNKAITYFFMLDFTEPFSAWKTLYMGKTIILLHSVIFSMKYTVHGQDIITAAFRKPVSLSFYLP